MPGSHEHENKNGMPASQATIGNLRNVIVTALVGAEPEPSTPIEIVIKNKLGSEAHPVDYSSVTDEMSTIYSVCLWGEPFEDPVDGLKAVDEIFEIAEVAGEDLAISRRTQEDIVDPSPLKEVEQVHHRAQLKALLSDPDRILSMAHQIAPRTDPVFEAEVQGILEKLRNI